MFTRRFANDDDAKALTIGGIAVGVAGSLIRLVPGAALWTFPRR